MTLKLEKKDCLKENPNLKTILEEKWEKNKRAEGDKIRNGLHEIASLAAAL